jgi:hypothetical protein
MSRLVVRKEYNIKMKLGEICREGVEWIHLTQDMERCGHGSSFVFYKLRRMDYLRDYQLHKLCAVWNKVIRPISVLRTKVKLSRYSPFLPQGEDV